MLSMHGRADMHTRDAGYVPDMGKHQAASELQCSCWQAACSAQDSTAYVVMCVGEDACRMHGDEQQHMRNKMEHRPRACVIIM